MATHGPIRYRFNADFFTAIDTDEKAYWLGFLYADGTVVRSTVSLSLAWRDASSHLVKLKKALQADQPISRYCYPLHRSDFGRFSVSSLRLVKILAGHGLIPNKEKRLRFPLTVPTSLFGAFLRGYSDGDGSIYVVRHSPRYLRYTWRLFGCHLFLLDIQAKLHPIRSRLRPHKSIWMLTIDSTRELRRLASLLYVGARVYLERKRKVFDAVLQPSQCQWCRKEFEPVRKILSTQFCSKACRQRADRKSFSWQTKRVCPICQRAYLPQRVHQIVCSRKCRRQRAYLLWHS